ncbi:MAG: FHA domain-containing protein [Pseudomonadota bacterium]
MFGPKGFAAEVTEGIDLESRVTLTGDRITLGSGPDDNLRLGAADVMREHLVFLRNDKGRWEYFTTPSGTTTVDKGNPRTGLVRAGMWFRIGQETKVTLMKADAPAGQGKNSNGQVPLTIAIPAMLGMTALALLFVMGSAETPSINTLQTAQWFTGTDMTPALDACLAHDLTPPTAATTSAIDGPFWAFMADKSSTAAKTTLHQSVQNIIAETHILARENKLLEASEALRRIEYVLPLGRHDCPILDAARVDLALLELRGTR